MAAVTPEEQAALPSEAESGCLSTVANAEYRTSLDFGYLSEKNVWKSASRPQVHAPAFKDTPLTPIHENCGIASEICRTIDWWIGT
ncbi:unnamed protein product [Somion occarium]|uniref:Uncharacterized protein n=1 Tax=Somion occarium TaxID=3059160 RepID=A0ABP1DXX8_9APHY